MSCVSLLAARGARSECTAVPFVRGVCCTNVHRISSCVFHRKQTLKVHAGPEVVADLALINVDYISPSLWLGVFVGAFGLVLYGFKLKNAKGTKDMDIVTASLLMLAGGILTVQGWRLDPILMLSEGALATVGVYYIVQTIELRKRLMDEYDDLNDPRQGQFDRERQGLPPRSDRDVYFIDEASQQYPPSSEQRYFPEGSAGPSRWGDVRQANNRGRSGYSEDEGGPFAPAISGRQTAQSEQQQSRSTWSQALSEGFRQTDAAPAQQSLARDSPPEPQSDGFWEDRQELWRDARSDRPRDANAWPPSVPTAGSSLPGWSDRRQDAAVGRDTEERGRQEYGVEGDVVPQGMVPDDQWRRPNRNDNEPRNGRSDWGPTRTVRDDSWS